MRIVTAAQMREVEQGTVKAGVSLDTLMENAGKAVAEVVERDYGPVTGKSILILVGPGNNGSDGLVAGRHLASTGANVTAFVGGNRPSPDPKMAAAVDAGISVLSASDDPSHHQQRRHARDADLIVDAILGTGQNRHISPPMSGQLSHIRTGAESGNTPVIALDLPTGTDSDTGSIDPNGLPADRIVMLGFPKPGPYLNPSVDPFRDIETLDIGIPSGVRAPSRVELATDELAAPLVPERSIDGNKGTFGRALIIAGSKNFVGAARLACEAAARSGAGLVTLATAEPVYRLIASSFPDATYIPLPANQNGELSEKPFTDELGNAIGNASSLLIGPGLGQSSGAAGLVEQVILDQAITSPAVLDADCLNLLSQQDGWHGRIPSQAVLTPHPGEMARLTGQTVREIQDDRLGAAVAAATEWGAVVVLKGACTVIADPDGNARIIPFANSGLATAGTGDVLAGLIAGLLAQGLSPFDAATLGAYLHGRAGESAREWHGEASMLASDLLSELAQSFAAIRP